MKLCHICQRKSDCELSAPRHAAFHWSDSSSSGHRQLTSLPAYSRGGGEAPAAQSQQSSYLQPGRTVRWGLYVSKMLNSLKHAWIKGSSLLLGGSAVDLDPGGKIFQNKKCKEILNSINLHKLHCFLLLSNLLCFILPVQITTIINSSWFLFLQILLSWIRIRMF